MPLKFDTWSLDDATKAFESKKSPPLAESARRYYDGDHWQGTAGWAGTLPPNDDVNRQEIISQIEASFVFENAIKAVVDRHVSGVLGREPRFAMTVRRPLKDAAANGGTPEAPSSGEQTLIDVAEAALTGEWWDRRKPVKVLRDALRLALLQGRAVLRVYIPSGLRGDDGVTVKVTTQPGQEPVEAALNFVYFDALDATKAVVYTDDDSKREVGMFRYERDGQESVELTYLAEDNVTTTLRVVTSGSDTAAPLPLNGRLLMFEIEREALITGGVIALQKSINHARTMIGRNVNMAGFRERTFTGATPPGRWVDSNGAEVEEGTPGAKFVAGQMAVGAGATNFLVGVPIRDPEGNITGYSNPGVTYADPVDPTSLIKVIDSTFAALLHEVNQKHVAISGDATASAVSRKQARAEYLDDLRVTKGVIDEAGRWLIETILHLASSLVNNALRFRELRPEFAAVIDAGPIAAEEEASITTRYEKGLLSRIGAMERQGVEDADAEAARIDAEDEAAAQRADEGVARLANTAIRAPQDGAQRDDDGTPDASRTGTGTGGTNPPTGNDGNTRPTGSTGTGATA